MMTQTTLNLVTRELVPEDQRLAITNKLFGIHFPLKLEPVIYGITDRMADAYTGGYWDFYNLSNGGFYMAPSGDDVFHVTCENMFEDDLSADALGISACLYAYSNLSFGHGGFARECARHYHLLREYMMDHPEVRAILGAATNSKSGKVRSVPLNDAALDVLNQMDTRDEFEHVFINRQTGKPYTTIQKVWNRLRNAADLGHVRIHDLRHQYASFLVNSGRTLYEVQQILGHSTSKVTQRYSHLSTATLQNASASAADRIRDAMEKSA